MVNQSDERAVETALRVALWTAGLLLFFCFAYSHGTASSDLTTWASNYQMHDAAKINNVLVELNSATSDSAYPVEAMANVCSDQARTITRIQKRTEYPPNELQRELKKYLSSLQNAISTCATANYQWRPSDYSFLNEQFRLAAEQGKQFNQIAQSKGLLDIVRIKKVTP